MNDSRRDHYAGILTEVAKQSSQRERLAEEAERETVKLKKVEYMAERFGQEFEGVISSITKWGIYVELPNTIEGLIHVTNLYDDHYNYIEERYEMVGEHTGKTYKLGCYTCICSVAQYWQVWKFFICFWFAGRKWIVVYIS